MATWQELTVPGLVTSVVTAGALLFQNWRNGVREDKRRADDSAERQKDRDHARDMAELDARRQLDERWRDDRREAYAAMLSLAERSAELAERLMTQHVLRDKSPGDENLIERLSTEMEHLPRLVSLISLLGSQDSRREGELLGTMLYQLALAAWMLDSVPHPNDTTLQGKIRSLGVATTNVKTQAGGLVEAVRRDLGTA